MHHKIDLIIVFTSVMLKLPWQKKLPLYYFLFFLPQAKGFQKTMLAYVYGKFMDTAQLTRSSGLWLSQVRFMSKLNEQTMLFSLGVHRCLHSHNSG